MEWSMPRFHNFEGKLVQFTNAEEAARDAQEKAWADGAAARAWEALREDEIACKSLGVNPTNTKLTAFAIGAMFGGFAGSFFATRQAFISPESFTFIESAIIVAIVVLGGMGSQTGVVLASIFLIGITEIFRDLEQYRMIAFGGAMVLIMIFKPKGILANRKPTILMHGEKK